MADTDAASCPAAPEWTEAEQAAMQAALDQAHRARAAGEVPVGAVLLGPEGQVLAEGFNRTLLDHDPTAHAEIVVLRRAAHQAANHRLPGTRLFVTLEPCAMCMGAIFHARVAQVIFGASDPKTGACGSVLALDRIARLNHHTQARGGLYAHECGGLLRQFFHERRRLCRSV